MGDLVDWANNNKGKIYPVKYATDYILNLCQFIYSEMVMIG